ncbi:MAG: ABC transporter ATP-binding protein [Chloroflexi bacterium]|nr:MAG: ABC transporter ATP-binding protein [Chloroflexota bacterium]PIE80368.1 MAG: ABC transporter ATP-binding protein [Chloroflexota bacterium]
MFGLNLRRKHNRPAEDIHFSTTDVQNGRFVNINQVTKVYESTSGRFVALDGVDLQVERGKFVSIIGKSGSGKSTLINMITGIDRPTAGKINVGQTAVHTLNEEQIAIWRGKAIGVIFQFFQLLPTLTAVENIMLAMDYGNKFPVGERPHRAMHLLELVGMAEQAHQLPPLLSGGQQQSVAIARALANDPPLLTADEPTGNLDSKTANHILRLFENLVDNGKTILMVTHDQDLARRAQETVELADGKIVEQWCN